LRPAWYSSERGVATVWSVVVVGACFLMIGLVLDGGVILRARNDAFNLAGAAARVGAQELEPDAAAQGRVVLDPSSARSAALEYLDEHDARGVVAVAGSEVTVTVTLTADLQMLRVADGGSVDVSATATVAALKGAAP
jgi:Flp pilus assembly protein TadG